MKSTVGLETMSRAPGAQPATPAGSGARPMESGWKPMNMWISGDIRGGRKKVNFLGGMSPSWGPLKSLFLFIDTLPNTNH